MATLNWKGGENPNHKQAYCSFLRAASLCIERETALKEVTERIERAGGKVLERDLNRSLEHAYRYVREKLDAPVAACPSAHGDGRSTQASTPDGQPHAAETILSSNPTSKLP